MHNITCSKQFIKSLCEKILSDLCSVNELYILHANESATPRQLNTAISIFRHDFNILCSCNSINEKQKVCIIKLISLKVCKYRLDVSRYVVEGYLKNADKRQMVISIRLKLSIRLINNENNNTNNTYLTKYDSRKIFDYIPSEFSSLMMSFKPGYALNIVTNSKREWLRYLKSIFKLATPEYYSIIDDIIRIYCDEIPILCYVYQSV